MTSSTKQTSKMATQTEEAKAAADKAAADAKAAEEKAAADKAAADAKAAEEAKAPKIKKLSREEYLKGAKGTDTVVVGFKTPAISEDEDEKTIKKTSSKQHVKYAFWLALSKDNKGKVRFSTLKGTELLGYVDGETEVLFK